MDYSTISNKTNITEIEEVENGELGERYHTLKKQFDKLTTSYDILKQELHDTSRNYQTAVDVQQHLTIELESLQLDQERRKSEFTTKFASLHEEITLLREERNEASDRHSAEINILKEEIKRLKEEVNSKDDKIICKDQDNKEVEEIRALAAAAVNEADEAKASLDKTKMELEAWKVQAEMLNTHIEEAREIAKIHKEELASANDREAAALADLAEVRAMLHQFTEPQDSLQPHAAKGNSLFAEVEDKRQEMAKNLIQMKQTNSKLKRELANKQAELEALLHEKQTIWEQQLGAAAHYDRELIENYEERISQLEGITERQRRELARWFTKQSEPTANGWLPGVLDHLKLECEKLRAEVLSRGAAQLASAAQIRELRRKLAQATSGKPTTRQSSIENTNFTTKRQSSIEYNANLASRRQSSIETNSNFTKKDDDKENKLPGKHEKYVDVKPASNLDDVRKKVSFN